MSLVCHNDCNHIFPLVQTLVYVCWRGPQLYDYHLHHADWPNSQRHRHMNYTYDTRRTRFEENPLEMVRQRLFVCMEAQRGGGYKRRVGWARVPPDWTTHPLVCACLCFLPALEFTAGHWQGQPWSGEWPWRIKPRFVGEVVLVETKTEEEKQEKQDGAQTQGVIVKKRQRVSK